MLRTRLTTIDNPHDPFDEYRAWFVWDLMSGYNTPSLLGRIAQVSDDLSDADQEAANREAIEEIVRENVLGVYKLVEREVEEKFVT